MPPGRLGTSARAPGWRWGRPSRRPSGKAGLHDLERAAHASIVDGRQGLADVRRALVDRIEHLAHARRLRPGGAEVWRSHFVRQYELQYAGWDLGDVQRKLPGRHGLLV